MPPPAVILPALVPAEGGDAALVAVILAAPVPTFGGD